MTQQYYFKNAKWVGAEECSIENAAPIVRGEFGGIGAGEANVNRF